MPKELKGYELRPASRPGKSPLLSTTVAIINPDGKAGYCYVRFSEKLVTAVGKKMPHGLMPENPAYLLVVWSKEHQNWEVWASSADEQHKILLWEAAQTPSWLKFHKQRG